MSSMYSYIAYSFTGMVIMAQTAQLHNKARLQISVPAALKNAADSLFASLGTDTGTAVNMFLSQAVQEHGFPFLPTKRTTPSDGLVRTIRQAETEPLVHGGNADDMARLIDSL